MPSIQWHRVERFLMPTFGDAIVDDEVLGSGVGQSHDDHDQGQNDLRRHRGSSLVIAFSMPFNVKVRLTSLVETMLLVELLLTECEDFTEPAPFYVDSEESLFAIGRPTFGHFPWPTPKKDHLIVISLLLNNNLVSYFPSI